MSESPDEILIPIGEGTDDRQGEDDLPLPRRSMGLLTYVDAAIAIGSVLMAMWYLLEIDRNAVGFVLFWSAVPVLMLAVRWLARTRAMRAFAAIYLVSLGVGMAIAKMPSVMPSLSVEHRGNTQEAETFNRLDVVSRRVIVWSIGQSMVIFPAMLGYLIFLIPLRRRAPGDFTMGTCLLGLLVLWGMSAVTLLMFALWAVFGGGGAAA